MKAISGILFVAATCIGGGIIALPITLAKIGLVPSIIVMLITWFIIYKTALVNVELNLQAGKGTSLGLLCKRFSGSKAQIFGELNLKLLFYALLAFYITSASSILETIFNIKNVQILYMLFLCIVLFLPTKLVKKVNNTLFLCLLGIIGILIFFLLISVNWQNVPLIGSLTDINVWSLLIPVVFTSFGFQVIFHTMTDYYKCDAIVLKKVFFWGSFIPAIVYIIWTSSVLGAIYNHSLDFYLKMSNNGVEVGELISELSLIAPSFSVQILIKWIGFLAIITSTIGVGLGLVEDIDSQLENKISNPFVKRLLSIVLTVLPIYLVITIFSNAFIAILGFAGMILSFIAILIPIYLMKGVSSDSLYYPALKNDRITMFLSLIFGILIVCCGIYNLTL